MNIFINIYWKALEERSTTTISSPDNTDLHRLTWFTKSLFQLISKMHYRMVLSRGQKYQHNSNITLKHVHAHDTKQKSWTAVCYLIDAGIPEHSRKPSMPSRMVCLTAIATRNFATQVSKTTSKILLSTSS